MSKDVRREDGVRAPGATHEPTAVPYGHSVLDSLNEIVFQTDPVGNWSYLNRAWTDVLGYPIAETLGTNFLDYVHPDERTGTLAMFAAVVSGGRDRCHHVTRYRRADGGYRWMELRARVMYGDDRQIVGNTGTLIDITERRRAEELLAEQTAILELIAQDAALTTILTRIARLVARQSGGYVSISMPGADVEATSDPAPVERFGRNGDARPGQFVIAAVAGPPEEERVASGAGGATRPARPLQLAVPIAGTAGRRALGEIAVYAGRPLPLDDARTAVLARCADLAAIAIERRLAQEQVRRQALHDPLTGLANRALIEDRLGQAIRAAQRTAHAVALMLVDLDRFKDINDSLGHEAGDAALRHAAARIDGAVRQVDTAGRLGGDEFAVILPHVGEAAYAEGVARKVLGALAEPLVLGGMTIRLDASVGISLFPKHGTDPGTLLRRADVAMYRAKGRGGGHVVFDPAHDEDRQVLLGLAGELRRAIEQEELFLVYQPKIGLAEDDVAGVEALVRWRHPERGVLTPDRFIGLAESMGLMRDLSAFVLRRALQDRTAWLEQGFDLPVAVNLSASTLHDPSLLEMVSRALDDRGVAGWSLELEITESTLMAQPEAAIDAMTGIGRLGVRFAIDDFGTGYSSLAYLKRLPARLVKIDRSLIRDVPGDHRDASIVRSAVDLSHTIGMEVVAEGVEAESSITLLADLGCDYAQGFAIARPMAAEALVPWLVERRQDRVTAP